jgi:DNA-binding response OmpR family regulator
MVKLILADCTPSVFTAVQAAFPETEFEIITFSDGHEMIKKLETIQPDVILLNLFLDSKDGYDVCRFLNHQERFKTVPLFLLQGAFERVDEERMGGLEYRELIEEPFDSMRLVRKVRDAVEIKFDPQTLPEEPVSSEDRSGGAELEDKIKNLIAEHIRESEDRIVDRLKACVLEDMNKEE